MRKHILVATNGYEGTLPSFHYATWAAKVFDLPVVLLGVCEETDEHHPLEEMYGEAVQILKESGVSYRLELEDGMTEEIVKARAAQDDLFLLVFGPLGRPQIRRWMFGRSFRHIMAELDVPLLYTPESRLPVHRILVCLGGLGYAVTAEHLGLHAARQVGAEVTFLYVVQPIDMDYPETRKILENVDHLDNTDTLPGRGLREGMAKAKEAGLNAQVRVRQGNPVQEILCEIREGNYDLACMGSAYSAHGLRHLYTPNVTAEVAEASPCPILTARYGSGADL
jgi:nucleotide-binding universal stress UspA family protein